MFPTRETGYTNGIDKINHEYTTKNKRPPWHREYCRLYREFGIRKAKALGITIDALFVSFRDARAWSLRYPRARAIGGGKFSWINKPGRAAIAAQHRARRERMARARRERAMLAGKLQTTAQALVKRREYMRAYMAQRRAAQALALW